MTDALPGRLPSPAGRPAPIAPPPRPIRVLHAAAGLGLGGTEKTLQGFATGLDRDRFLCAVYSPQAGERAPLIRAAGVQTLLGGPLERALDRFQPDIVHIYRAGWPERLLLRPAARAGLPVVETNVFGRHDPSPDAAAIRRHLFMSRYCLERYALVHGADLASGRYDYLYNPVEVDDLARCRPDFSRPVMGRLSRPDPGKWSPLAWEIIPRLVRLVPGFRYRIVGGVEAAERFVREANLEDWVSFEPPLTDGRQLAGFLASLSLLAHANDTGETFGMVIAEAMAAGLPVITHPCPGLKDNAQLELVDHGVTGFVARDAEEYADQAAWLLTRPDEARAMGERGRDKARRLYRLQDIARRLEAVYLDVLREAAPRRP